MNSTHLTHALAVAAAALLLTGCGSVRETLPTRSALEQLLVSTAADRAAAELPLEPFADRTVYIDATNLECQDKPYVIQSLRTALRGGGVRIVDSKEKAELVLEAASGAMSINRRDMLFGIPAVPLPLAVGGQIIKLPELPLWKVITYRGRAKLLLSAVDVETGAAVADVGLCYGQARDTYWWLLILGPMRHTDLPMEVR